GTNRRRKGKILKVNLVLVSWGDHSVHDYHLKWSNYRGQVKDLIQKQASGRMVQKDTSNPNQGIPLATRSQAL
ncbi:MAG: hypothetical protein ACE1ZE_00805, partial [Candidatus Binatia bacterium]